MTITTILCDLDGTLVDSRRDIAIAFQHAWRNVVGGIPPSAAAIAQHIGKPLAEMLSELGGVLSPSLLSTFLTAYRQTYTRQDARLTQPYPGVIPTLQALSAFTLGVVTTKESRQAEIVLRRLALIPFFQHIQGGTFGLRLSLLPIPYLRPSPHYTVHHRMP
jgi:phosphoglycolate phosphatase-like HAD superfamily hydrolase